MSFHLVRASAYEETFVGYGSNLSLLDGQQANIKELVSDFAAGVDIEDGEEAVALNAAEADEEGIMEGSGNTFLSDRLFDATMTTQ